MTRIVRRVVEVEAGSSGDPLLFRDGPAVRRVRMVLDRWAEAGEWWRGEGVRRMWRVWTEDHGIYDLEWSDGTWRIYKVWD